MAHRDRMLLFLQCWWLLSLRGHKTKTLYSTKTLLGSLYSARLLTLPTICNPWRRQRTYIRPGPFDSFLASSCYIWISARVATEELLARMELKERIWRMERMRTTSRPSVSAPFLAEETGTCSRFSPQTRATSREGTEGRIGSRFSRTLLTRSSPQEHQSFLIILLFRHLS